MITDSVCFFGQRGCHTGVGGVLLDSDFELVTFASDNQSCSVVQVFQVLYDELLIRSVTSLDDLKGWLFIVLLLQHFFVIIGVHVSSTIIIIIIIF